MKVKLSNFISTEFFFNHNSSKQEENHEEDPSALYTWIHENTDHGRLTAELKEGNAFLRGKAASVFHRGGHVIEDVYSAFSRDLKAYETILKTYKSQLTEFGKTQKSIIKDLDKIADPKTTYEQVRAVLLKYKNQAANYTPQHSIAAHFREPSEHFLGDYETPFLTDEKYFETKQQLSKQPSAELPALTQENEDKIVTLAFDIQKLQIDLSDLDEKIGVCIDQTDSPIRGFVDEIYNEPELVAILNPFSEHGMVFEDHNAGLVDILVKRVDNLYEALWSYIRHSCH